MISSLETEKPVRMDQRAEPGRVELWRGVQACCVLGLSGLSVGEYQDTFRSRASIGTGGNTYHLLTERRQTRNRATTGRA